MPKGSPAPWFRKRRNSWFITLDGRQVNLETADRKEALKRWHALALQEPSIAPVAPRLSVRELIAEFLEWAERHTRSYGYYANFLTRFARTVPKNLPAADLRPFRVTQWLDMHSRWGANTRRCAIAAVKRVYHWAVGEGYLDFTPLSGLRKPPSQRREVVLTTEQRGAILSTVTDRRFRDYLTLIQETGARPQEIRTVEARHVHPEQHVWIFPASEHKTGKKTGRARVVYLTPTAWEITKRLVALYPEGPLCRNKFDRPWTCNSIRCRFRRLRKTLGSKVPADLCAYHFRHTYATNALEQGVDPVTLAELMGHRDATMISRVYQHLNQRVDHLRNAARRAVGEAKGEQ